MKALLVLVIAFAGLGLEFAPAESPAPEPLTCYGLAPYCGYPLVQCCIGSEWSCCRKSF